jgi:hypothetical protein
MTTTEVGPSLPKGRTIEEQPPADSGDDASSEAEAPELLCAYTATQFVGLGAALFPIGQQQLVACSL